MESTTFKSRVYVIEKTLPVSELLVREGIRQQMVIVGKNGGTRLLQEFTNGLRRTIGRSGNVEIEYPNQ